MFRTVKYLTASLSVYNLKFILQILKWILNTINLNIIQIKCFIDRLIFTQNICKNTSWKSAPVKTGRVISRTKHFSLSLRRVCIFFNENKIKCNYCLLHPLIIWIFRVFYSYISPQSSFPCFVRFRDKLVTDTHKYIYIYIS